MTRKHFTVRELKKEINSKFESLEAKIKYILKKMNIEMSIDYVGAILNKVMIADDLSISSSDVKLKQLESSEKNYNPEHINEWLIPDLSYNPTKYTSKDVTSNPRADIDLLI